MLKHGLKESVELIKQLCSPFAFPDEYSQDDWHDRVTRLVRVIDYLTFRISETIDFAYSHDVNLTKKYDVEADELWQSFAKIERQFELVTPGRGDYSACTPTYHAKIDYNVVSKERTNAQHVIRALCDVTSVEKLAISTCSLAIHRYCLPTFIIIELCNTIRDECLHLVALTRLIGQDPLMGGWITQKRVPAWEQVKKCESPSEHILLEHCMFEGEGAIAASYSVYEAKTFAFPDCAVSVLERIAVEELRHAIMGYYLAHTLSTTDMEREKDVNRIISLISEIEPLAPAETFKGAKQRIALELIRN